MPARRARCPRGLALLIAAAAGCDGGGGGTDAGGDAGVGEVDAAPPADAAPPDVTAPTVIAVTPAQATRQVAAAAVITVEFSEAMDLASLTAGLALEPATAAAVTLDDAGVTATLTPAAPLRLAVTYTVVVPTSVTDLAGNGLAAEVRSRLTVAAAPLVRLDGGGAAFQQQPRVAFDDAGNGVAVWLTEVFPGVVDPYYATYVEATGLWGGAVRLDASSYAQGIGVASDGTSFQVLAYGPFTLTWELRYDPGTQVFTEGAPETHDSAARAVLVAGDVGYLLAGAIGSIVRVRLHDGTSWGASGQLTGGSGAITELVAAEDGGSYAIAYVQVAGSRPAVFFNAHVGGAWEAGSSRLDPVASTNPARHVDLAGARDGTGFMTVWDQADSSGFACVYAARYLRGGASGTLAASQIVAGGADPIDETWPRIAARGGGYAVAYLEGGSTVWGLVHDGSAWAATGTLLSSAGTAGDHAIAANLIRYAVSWRQQDGGDWRVHARVHASGSGWLADDVLGAAGADAVEVALAAKAETGNNGFAVVFRALDAAGVGTIHRVIYNAGAWAAGVQLDGGGGVVATPWVAARTTGSTSFISLWSESGAIVARAGGGNQTISGAVDAAVGSAAVTGDGGGASVALWEQRVGQRTGLWGRVFTGDAWSAPALLSDRLDAGGYQARAAGDAGRFAVVYRVPGTGGLEVRARLWDGSAWHAEQTLGGASGLARVVASAGQFTAAWAAVDDGTADVMTASYDGSSWSTPASIYSTTDALAMVELAGSASGACAAWMTSSPVVLAAVATGTTWAAPSLIEPILASVDFPLAIAAGPAGCAVAWALTPSIRAARHDGSAWAAFETVSMTPAEAGSGGDLLQVVAGDDGFAYLWTDEGQELYTRVWDLTTGWDAELDVGPARSGSLAASAGEYLVAYRAGEVAAARVHDGTGWQAEVTLSAPIDVIEPALTGDASGFRLLVAEHDPTSSATDLRTIRREQGAWWDSSLLLVDDLARPGQPLAAAGGGRSTGVLAAPPGDDSRFIQLAGLGAF